MAQIANRIKNILLYSVFLKNLDIKKSKRAPVIEDVPIIIPIMDIENPRSCIKRGVMYDIVLSKMVKNSTTRENMKTVL